MENRPTGREKHVTGAGKGVYKRGDGLGTGPVGNAGGYAGKNGGSSGGGKRAGGGKPNLLIIILAAVVLLGGGGGLTSLLGGGGNNNNHNQQLPSAGDYTSVNISNMLSGISNVSPGWTTASNNGKVISTVDSAARAKRTRIKGSGKDVVTIMVYMCGTDLESGSGMGTADLSEMASAQIGKNVNLIVFTGGCKRWQNSLVSSQYNQIYRVVGGGQLELLVENAGTAAMTNPDNLSSFIQWCKKNYPANRNELIFWDHGGGSLSGYGYDEKNPNSGSMNLTGINKALKNGGVTFDFIGFDACLMATLETALTLAPYADYMIASEETEPGVGWYYTNWLTKLSANTSMPTLDIGRNIADDFVNVCAQKCAGQKTTLSVVDLSELEKTAPKKFTDFASDTCELMKTEYQSVSKARSGAREFAASSKIDQVDLIDFATKVGSDEAKELVNCLLRAVKYNKTSTNMTNAYGLSIYFPYKKTSQVNSAVATYEALGLDDEYTRCIQQFASMEVSGQAVSGGAASPLAMLMGSGSSSGNSVLGGDAVTQLLGSLLGGNLCNVAGLTSGNSGFLGRSLDVNSTAAFITDNQFDAGQLVWLQDGDDVILHLSEEQWKLVQRLELNVFFDDGEGYIDLGLDNVFDFNDKGALLGEYDGTWLAVNQQPVAYYHVDTVTDGDKYTITGRVPVMLNKSSEDKCRAELILVFDNDHPYGYLAGVRTDYHDGETETIAKGMTELKAGDEIDFLCDYYSYAGAYQDSYYLGETMIYDGTFEISNVEIDAKAASASYRFTDIYNQEYWTPQIP